MGGLKFAKPLCAMMGALKPRLCCLVRLVDSKFRMPHPMSLAVRLSCHQQMTDSSSSSRDYECKYCTAVRYEYGTCSRNNTKSSRSRHRKIEKVLSEHHTSSSPSSCCFDNIDKYSAKQDHKLRMSHHYLFTKNKMLIHSLKNTV